jgi:hypothetical protein
MLATLTSFAVFHPLTCAAGYCFIEFEAAQKALNLTASASGNE